MSRCQYFPTWSIDSTVPIKIPVNYFIDINTLTLKFIWKAKRQRLVNMILKEKNKVGGLMLPDFKTYYKATVIMTVWCWWKSKQVDQWKRIDSPEIEFHKYSQLISDKRGKAIQWSNDSLFNKWCRNHWTSTCKRMNLNTDLSQKILKMDHRPTCKVTER